MAMTAPRRRSRLACLVRGSGDVGSAVAHALLCRGMAVAIHDLAAPGYPRRGMAFVDALFDGSARLEGVRARRVDDLRTLRPMALRRESIPVFSGPLQEALEALEADVLVDARMRKRDAPEAQLGMAALTLGLGPGFVAGRTVDLAIETAWGEGLGGIVRDGATLALCGEPRMVLGHSRTRFVYAPAPGRMQSDRRIGEALAQGEEIARLDGRALQAPFAGVLVGLTRPGVVVREGAKVIEVDPRGERALAFGIGTRPRAIAAGVLRAIETAFARESPDPGAGRATHGPARHRAGSRIHNPAAWPGAATRAEGPP
jgi:xanthine dehydrogenase accessory factor